MNKVNDLETIELLMEKNVISHNHFYVNDKSLFDNHNISQIQINENDSLLAFSDIFDKHLKSMELPEEYSNSDYIKIINDLISGKIVVRNKKLIEVLSVLKIFKHNEDNRMKFIEKLKNLDCTKLLEDIDHKYNEIYNEFYNPSKKEKEENKKSVKSYIEKKKETKSPHFEIDLDKLEIPHYNTYNYLMTFERSCCSLHIEKDNLFLYYYFDNEEFKINLCIKNDDLRYAPAVDVNKKKILIPYAENKRIQNHFKDEFVCLNQMSIPFIYIYNYFNPDDSRNYKTKELLNIEYKYIDYIFKYHNINLLNELSKKYVNYQFEINYNHVFEYDYDDNHKKVYKSYISLYIY